MVLNTTTASNNVSGHEGDKVNITAYIVDEESNPVQNGTATLTLNGNNYTVEVKNGKAVFTDVVLPSENTTAVIKYAGNDNYNPSSTTINVTIIADPEPSPEPIPDPEPIPVDPTPGPSPNPNPNPGPDNNESNSVNGGSDENGPVENNMHNTGNPIFAILLVLLVLVSNVSLRRRK